MHIWPELNAYADDIVRQSGLSSSLNDLIGTDPYADQMFRNLGSTHVDVMIIPRMRALTSSTT